MEFSSRNCLNFISGISSCLKVKFVGRPIFKNVLSDKTLESKYSLLNSISNVTLDFCSISNVKSGILLKTESKYKLSSFPWLMKTLDDKN